MKASGCQEMSCGLLKRVKANQKIYEIYLLDSFVKENERNLQFGKKTKLFMVFSFDGFPKWYIFYPFPKSVESNSNKEFEHCQTLQIQYVIYEQTLVYGLHPIIT